MKEFFQLFVKCLRRNHVEIKVSSVLFFCILSCIIGRSNCNFKHASCGRTRPCQFLDVIFHAGVCTLAGVGLAICWLPSSTRQRRVWRKTFRNPAKQFWARSIVIPRRPFPTSIRSANIRRWSCFETARWWRRWVWEICFISLTLEKLCQFCRFSPVL